MKCPICGSNVEYLGWYREDSKGEYALHSCEKCDYSREEEILPCHEPLKMKRIKKILTDK